MPSHRAVYNAFAVSSGPQTAMKEYQLRPQTSTSAPSPATHAAFTQSASSNQQSNSSFLDRYSPPIMAQPIESDPQSLIFAPPNTVPTDGFRQDSGDSFENPTLTKTAGDVSLNGSQLVAFIYKATTRLPPAKCEGIQLKLQQLTAAVEKNRLSEPCLQKLNYLVDAIDRNLFNEAAEYLDQIQALFPLEVRGWGQGIRLLVHELRGSVRVGSAGIRGQ